MESDQSKFAPMGQSVDSTIVAARRHPMKYDRSSKQVTDSVHRLIPTDSNRNHLSQTRSAMYTKKADSSKYQELIQNHMKIEEEKASKRQVRLKQEIILSRKIRRNE